MGRWSRQLAPRLVTWLGVPDGVHWMDVGCGTGALTAAICNLAHPTSVVGCDPSQSFIEYAQSHCNDSRASFVVAGVGNLPPRPAGYGSIASLFALNFFPDAEAAIREMRSLASPAGIVSACVWDYGEKMEFLRYFWDAAIARDPAAQTFDEGRRFLLCHPDALVNLFRSSGLADVRCEGIEIPTVFESFDDYWRPFLGGTGPAPSYVASLHTNDRLTLARELEHSLPHSSTGAIALTARAWAVRGSCTPADVPGIR